MNKLDLGYEDIKLLLFLSSSKWTYRINSYKDSVLTKCYELNLEGSFDTDDILRIDDKDYTASVQFTAKDDIYVIDWWFYKGGVAYDITDLISDYIEPKTINISDNINPKHYKLSDNFETIDVIKASTSEEGFKGYLTGNIIKYVTRYRNKNGLEDLKKAKWCLDRLIEEWKEE